MVRRLAALALPGLLVSSCAWFPFSTDDDDPGTVVGKRSVVIANGRIPCNGEFIPIEGIGIPDGTVIPLNIVVDKRGQEYEEVDLRELDRISKESESNPMNPSATQQGLGNSAAET
jgi:hypothetical protein